MDVVIGIDTGTTATKGIAAAADGRLRAHTSVHYPLSVPGPGRAELDPVQLVDAAVKALTDVAAACRERGDRVIAYTHGRKTLGDRLAVAPVTIPDHVGWCFVPREGICELAGDQLGCRMIGDAQRDQASPLMSQDDQHE